MAAFAEKSRARTASAASSEMLSATQLWLQSAVAAQEEVRKRTASDARSSPSAVGSSGSPRPEPRPEPSCQPSAARHSLAAPSIDGGFDGMDSRPDAWRRKDELACSRAARGLPAPPEGVSVLRLTASERRLRPAVCLQPRVPLNKGT